METETFEELHKMRNLNAILIQFGVLAGGGSSRKMKAKRRLKKSLHASCKRCPLPPIFVSLLFGDRKQIIFRDLMLLNI